MHLYFHLMGSGAAETQEAVQNHPGLGDRGHPPQGEGECVAPHVSCNLGGDGSEDYYQATLKNVGHFIII